MPAQKYSVNQHPIQTLLTWITEREIAIPEIQRPFVWDATKVRDLLDSLLNGFPIGYLIAWRNPNVKLKERDHLVRQTHSYRWAAACYCPYSRVAWMARNQQGL